MKELAIVLLIAALYMFVSWLVRKVLFKVKIVLFIVVCSGYAIFTKYLFDLVIYLHEVARLKGIYFEFGHADLGLLELYFVCILIGFANIISILVKKYRRSRGLPALKNDTKL